MKVKILITGFLPLRLVCVAFDLRGREFTGGPYPSIASPTTFLATLTTDTTTHEDDVILQNQQSGVTLHITTDKPFLSE